MSLTYLKEYLDDALLALELAKKEMAHLLYTHQTLYGQTIDLKWVKALAKRQDLAEKVDAFVSRFGRLQDQIGEKLIPRFIALSGGKSKSLLDALAYAEKMGWMDSAEAFVSVRKLRNLLVHEYMTDADSFLESLQNAKGATNMLMEVVTRIERYADILGIT